jgi:F0F1-type ATP synthase assembly protein I
MIKSLLDEDQNERPDDIRPSRDFSIGSGPEVLNIFDGPGSAIDEQPDTPGSSGHYPNTDPDPGAAQDEPKKAVDYSPPTSGESVRMAGLAWTAGIMFFGSIVFMLILGWLVDLLLGSSPWGIVGGIVLGSIIGFIQFFRINAEILRTPKGSRQDGSLIPNREDETASALQDSQFPPDDEKTPDGL